MSGSALWVWMLAQVAVFGCTQGGGLVARATSLVARNEEACERPVARATSLVARNEEACERPVKAKTQCRAAAPPPQSPASGG